MCAQRLGMVIDTKKCIACNSCAVACKIENNLPNGIWWNRVMSVGGPNLDSPSGEYPHLKMDNITLACQHCENPACVKVCPVGATYKDPDTGVVRQDYDKCIGCRMCMAAGPYNARVFNWEEPVRDPDFNYGDKDVPVRTKGVMEKCTMCKERTDRGDEPMCVVCCPTKARTFGDLDDPNSEVSRMIREKHAYVLLEEQGTRPQVHYFN